MGVLDEVFGLDVNGPPDGVMPLEVIGVVKFLDENANPDYWVFNSFGLTTVEAVGMAVMLDLQCRDELPPGIYFEPAEDDDEDA